MIWSRMAKERAPSLYETEENSVYTEITRVTQNPYWQPGTFVPASEPEHEVNLTEDERFQRRNESI